LTSLETATKTDCSSFEQQWLNAIQNTSAPGEKTKTFIQLFNYKDSY